MATVAEQLRHAREARQMSVEQVADITKLRTDHVRALEEGNYAFFAAPVYIQGFVRTYANLVKLDVPQIMATLDAELGLASSPGSSAGETAAGPMNALTHQLANLDWRRAMFFLSVIGFVCLLAVGWFSFRNYQNRDPLRDLKPAVYEPKSGHTGERLPLP